MCYIRGFQTSADRYYFSEDDSYDEDFYLFIDVANTSGVEHIYYFDNFDIFRFWCNTNKDIIGIIDNYEFDEVYYLCFLFS